MQVLSAAARGEVTSEQAAAELASPCRSANTIMPRADGRPDEFSLIDRTSFAVMGPCVTKGDGR
jgi:hypothetical protein